MGIRVPETRHDYEKIIYNPAFVAVDDCSAWCDHCLSRIQSTDADCPTCRRPVSDDMMFFIGELKYVAICAPKGVINSKLSKAERMRLYPPEPPPPRGWLTKVLDFLQSGI